VSVLPKSRCRRIREAALSSTELIHGFRLVSGC
jgi:hypothetical protein